MASQLKTIFDTFQQQALIIAEEVYKAGYTGHGIQEESITDTLLNRIQYEHKENFATRKFTKKEEGNISGADWLWCIGEPGSWITFAIQAKIANIKTGRVNFLHSYKVPISNVSVFSRPPVLQSLDIELAKVEGSTKWKRFPKVFERKVEKLQDSDRFFMLPDGR